MARLSDGGEALNMPLIVSHVSVAAALFRQTDLCCTLIPLIVVVHSSISHDSQVKLALSSSRFSPLSGPYPVLEVSSAYRCDLLKPLTQIEDDAKSFALSKVT